MTMLAPVTHILPLTSLRRARLLPTGGRVLVRAGQKVSAIDPVAESELSGEHILIDVRQALGFTRPAQAEKAIERKVGEKLQPGDVIASAGSVFRKVVRAPSEGTILSIAGGQVLIEGPKMPFQLLAGISGEVAEIIPERGAIIETSGALIQGVWGNDRIQVGMLLALARQPDDELTNNDLDVSMRGSVILAGYCSQAATLQFAAQLSLRGLILGSMSADLIPLARRLEFPLILLEGFGKIPVNSVAYNILATNEKRDVCLNAAMWNTFSGEQPEIVIPLPASGELAVETDEFREGQTVRIQGAPYAGQVGVLVQTPSGLSMLPNGLRVAAAEVRLESGRQVTVPLANLDVLE